MTNNLMINASKTVALSLSIGRSTRNPNPDITFVIDGQTFVGVIAKLNYYLPHNTLTLYYTLIQSHLLYALPVWASTYETYLLKLKNIGIISKCPIRSSITPQYYKFKILKREDL